MHCARLLDLAQIRTAVWCGLTLVLLAASAPADGFDAVGNTDGVLNWRLGRLDPGGSVTETVLFAYAGTHDELVRILEHARANPLEGTVIPVALPAEENPSVTWIKNETTNLALHPDGSFFWEGLSQALVCERGGQLSRFSYRIQYDDGAPKDAGVYVTRKGVLENLRIVEPVRRIDEIRSAGLLETGDGRLRIRILAAMGEGAICGIAFTVTNAGGVPVSNLSLSAYANLESAHDHWNDYSLLDADIAGLLVVDPPTGMCLAMAGSGRPASGYCGVWASESQFLSGEGPPFEEWKSYGSLAGHMAERLARMSIPHPPAPYVVPEEPVTRTLTRDESREALERDWLFQAEGGPLDVRAAQEIAWARELAERLERDPRTEDLDPELAELDRLESRLEAKPDGGGSTAAADDAKALYLAVRRVKRRILFRNPVVDFEKVLFIDHPYTQGSEWPHEARHRNGMMAVPGGRLLELSGLHPGGEVRRIGPDRPGSYWRPDLSFDATKVLFCFKPHDGKSFHLYEAGLEGKDFRQLTFGDYDDLDPIYLPDGHIVFSTSRCHTYIRCMPYTYAYVLARCDGDGRNIYLIGRGNEPDWLPTLLKDGRVIYTRWEYTDKALWRIQSLWTVHPDGTNTAVFWGNQSVWPDMLIEPRPIPGSRRVMFTGAAHHDWFAGSIGIIDPAMGYNFPDGLTKVTADVAWPECGLPPKDPVESPRYHTSGRYDAYKTPFPLSEEDFLVSARGEGKYRLYLMDVHGNRELIHEGAHHIWHALPVKPRAPPPVLPDRVAWPRTAEERLHPEPGVLYSADIHEGVPDLPRGMARYLRVIQMDARTYTTWTRDGRFQGPCVSLIQDDGVKRILGTVPVEEDGSVHFEVPPGRALHFQVLDEHFRALQTMRSFTGVMPGERRGCTGCHELHSVTPQSGRSLALRRAPSKLTPPPWGDESIGYERFVQPVLDQYCGRCHQGEGEGRAKLDLTLRPGHLFFNEPYVTLVGGAQFSGLDWQGKDGIAGAIMAENFGQSDPQSYVTFRPMKHLSYASKLVEIAMSGKHHDVKADPSSLRRLIAWVDANCPYRGEEEVLALPDPDFPGIEFLPIRPTCRSAPKIIRP